LPSIFLPLPFFLRLSKVCHPSSSLTPLLSADRSVPHSFLSAYFQTDRRIFPFFPIAPNLFSDMLSFLFQPSKVWLIVLSAVSDLPPLPIKGMRTFFFPPPLFTLPVGMYKDGLGLWTVSLYVLQRGPLFFFSEMRAARRGAPSASVFTRSRSFRLFLSLPLSPPPQKK